ncbi:MAG: aminotransferase class I/II-fold pyridoxal phosphate-dependent enzyme, partial [Firmicutes bacterium]|nr:aminotransferase class I/II-fold pyridoxal phosphate-dependent enzyme [Bacillota bacterium]
MRLAERALGISPSPTLSIDAKAKQMKAAGIKVISFGVGEPDFDTPAAIREAAKLAIDQGYTRYTAPDGAPELKAAVRYRLAKDIGIDYANDEILVSVGGKHALFNAILSLVDPGDGVL